MNTILPFLLFSFTCAQIIFPQPDQYGDYHSSESMSWQTWEVVDQDSGGLNCRISEEFRQAWLEHYLYQGTPKMNIYQWSIVKKFNPQTILTANLAPAGNGIIYDDRGKPWLKVKLTENTDKICFVRANSAYIKPTQD